MQPDLSSRIYEAVIDSTSHENRNYLLQDLGSWNKRKIDFPGWDREAFTSLFAERQEFRSLFLYRLRMLEQAELLKKFNRELPSPVPNWMFVTNLFLSCNDIGPGFYIEHGFSTIIFAKSIGKNFHVNQNVTIGTRKGSYSTIGGNYPTIGDNVSVHCHAVVIGNITIGNNVKIGAGAIVVDSVPSNCTAVSPKARIIPRS